MTDDDQIRQLERLAELHRQGILTDAELAEQKHLVLSAPHAPAPRRRRRPGRKAILIACGVLVVLGGAGGGLAAKLAHDNRVQRDAVRAEEDREQARAAARQRAEDARIESEREAEKALEEIELDLRRDLVQDLRRSVTADFRERVTDGVLEGPILGTSCNPVDGGIQDLEAATGKFECLVATERLEGDGRSGYPVDATINYTEGSYTWQLSS